MSDLKDLFKVIAEGKKDYEENNPIGQKIKAVKDTVKTDLSSLFEELASLNKQLVVLEEEQQQLITEIPIPSGIPDEARDINHLPEVDLQQDALKYLRGKSFQQPDPDLVSKNIDDIRGKIKFLEQAIGRIAATGPGGGEVNLRYLDDIARDTIGDGKYLRYNATTGKFEFNQLTSGFTQIQSDWDQTDNTLVDYIKNKPTDVSEFTDTNELFHEYTKQVIYYGKADEAISKGDVVMFAGAQGDHILFVKADMNAIGFIPEWVMGVAKQNLAKGDFGDVIEFGILRDYDTSGFTQGALLYLSDTTPGGYTETEPTAPNHSILIAAALNSTGSANGAIQIRPSHTKEIDELHGVLITNKTSGDTLQYNGTNWVNLPVNTIVTNTTIVQNIIDGSGWNLPGPYTNEANAAAAGVGIGQAYYDNGGTVRVRQT